jgi:hypothetical protein
MIDENLGLTTMDEGCFVRSPLKEGETPDAIFLKWLAARYNRQNFRMFDCEHHPLREDSGLRIQEPGFRSGSREAGARLGRAQFAL